MRELRAQLVGALLVILTLTAITCAGINYQQQERYHLPDDGATWMDMPAPDGTPRIVAVHLEPGSTAERAGIREGDVLLRIGGRFNKQGVPVRESNDVAKLLQRIGAWGTAEYTLDRSHIEIRATVVVSDANRDKALMYQYAVGAAWLSVGLFVYFRRTRAPRSTLFYVLCLTAFVMFTFHYTGKLNNFDTAIYIGNVVAGLLTPALFLHFCLTFPDPRKGWGKMQLLSVYAPAVSLIALQLGVAIGVVRTALPLLEVRWVLDRAWILIFAVSFLAGAFLLHRSYRRQEDPIVRQQLKWLRNGTLFGIVPFAAFYALPYVAGIVPTPEMRLAVLCLGLIPVTWAYALLRYRLMDVDIIFQQGYVYLLATIAVIGVVSLLVFALAQRDGLSPSAVILLVIVAAFVFEPLRNWIQQLLDRYIFYKDRWDYRHTLIAFARELSSEMDLERSLASVTSRLLDTLQVANVGFFLPPEDGSGFSLHSLVGKEGKRTLADASDLDLSFLDNAGGRPYLFFERTRHAFDVVTREMPPSIRQTISRLDLTYYFPCQYRGRTLGWLGVSRSIKGDFLSSDDVDLLVTLSGYVAMAIENARLYRSLDDKAKQYERLKEFSENIVESINVGILAADLEGRVESWNSEIERLTGIPRAAAVGRRLSDLLPQDFYLLVSQVQDSDRVHQLYKQPFRMQSPHPPANGNGNGAGDASRDCTVNAAIAPLVTREGECIGRLIILTDVTEREELERRLMQADKLSSIGLLAAGVAHEVNTPLAVISTYAQMLAKQVRGDDTKTQMLDRIAKQTFRASEIVNSLLNFSRTSSTDFEEIDLNRIVRETLSLLEHQLAKASVTVVTDLDDSAPPVRGNTGKLQQVFLNLFLNARDAMEGGGTLTVRSRAESTGIRIEVRDTGAGIPRDHLTRIFDPFFTTKGSRKGTGLGLSVSYGIVEEHGGMIEADSRPGEGAVFRIELPAAGKLAHADHARTGD